MSIKEINHEHFIRSLKDPFISIYFELLVKTQSKNPFILMEELEEQMFNSPFLKEKKPKFGFYRYRVQLRKMLEEKNNRPTTPTTGGKITSNITSSSLNLGEDGEKELYILGEKFEDVFVKSKKIIISEHKQFMNYLYAFMNKFPYQNPFEHIGLAEFFSSGFKDVEDFLFMNLIKNSDGVSIQNPFADYIIFKSLMDKEIHEAENPKESILSAGQDLRKEEMNIRNNFKCVAEDYIRKGVEWFKKIGMIFKVWEEYFKKSKLVMYQAEKFPNQMAYWHKQMLEVIQRSQSELNVKFEDIDFLQWGEEDRNA